MKLREDDREKADPAEFFTILTTIMNKFQKAFRRIEKLPHNQFQKESRVLPAGRVKNINRQSIKWLRKNSHFYDKTTEIPYKMLNIEKKISHDTFENRFVRWIIEQLKKKLTLFKEKYIKVYGDDNNQIVIQEIKNIQRKFDYMLEHTFLKQVGEIHKLDSLSLVLQMAPGYRELYKYYLILRKGLSLKGEFYNLSMKKLWQLYEYWCFLKLNRILADEYNLIQQNFVVIDDTGINVSLEKSTEAEVKFKNPRTDEEFSLLYNTVQGEGITTKQRPDNVLSLTKENSEVEYKFIFDAKYRVNMDSDQGIPGPEESTINTMHRYRDAVVYNSQNKKDYKRTVVGALVLFPCKQQDKFKKHPFYKSIEKVNVGAFPFLPGVTDLVSQFLKNVVEESFFSGYERNILPRGTKRYNKKTEFKQNVLVGSLSDKKQLDFILIENIYHIPCEEIRLQDYNLEYVTIYQSKEKFAEECGIRHIWQIDRIDLKKRKEIPFKNKSSDEPYYIFYLKNHQILKQPVLPENYGVSGSHIFTNYMLLKQARTLPDLHIKTREQWRVWLECKRLRKEIKVLVEGNRLNKKTSIKGFSVAGIKVEVKDKDILIKRNNRVEEKSIYDFVHNLRGVFKDLMIEL